MIKKISFCTVVLMMTALVACNKQLEQIPGDNINDLNFWKNETDVDKFNLGVYAQLRAKMSQNYLHYMAGDFRAGSFLSTEKLANNQTLNQVFKSNTLKVLKSQNSEYTSIFDWTAFTQAVESCNLALFKIDEVPDGKFYIRPKSYYQAEARFQRAFIFFYMVRLYGDIPMSVKARNSEPLGRAPKDSVLDFVENELTAILPILPEQQADNNWKALRPIRSTAYALLAHVYAWRKKYDLCEDAASKVITSNNYSLVAKDPTSYRKIFQGQSTEGIFEIDFSNANGRNEITATGGTPGPKCGGFMGNSFYSPVWSFPSKDTMRKIWIGTDARRPAYCDSTKNPLDLIGSTDTVRYAFAKYAFATSMNGYNYFDANIVIFRLADIYLLRAEARASKSVKDYTGARDDLNVIRKRAGLADDTSPDADLLMTIFMERYRELFGEGHLYFDLVRMRDLQQLKKILPVVDTYFSEDSWTWPIADNAFTNNPYMKQSMYWLRG